jgi:hypothetical protein
LLQTVTSPKTDQKPNPGERESQKARKEKEPNPDKKPNVTKYTPKAGGKSNKS